MNTFIVEAENYKTLQTENVDISEYGITPDSVYSIKFEKGQDDTLMPQYQVRYPAHEEVTDELWNWLEEYGCLEPYQKVQQYYEDYQAMERKFANERERKNALRRMYGNTYWYYYDYKK